MRMLAQVAICTCLVVLTPGGPVQAQNLARNITVHIDRQTNPAPTPIHQQYLALIQSASDGDEIILLQKYFRNKVLNQALVDAAGHGVKVLGIYGQVSSPQCEELLPPESSIDCSRLFVQRRNIHHKSMVIHRSNGNTTAITGSFNLRERHLVSPRAHTALTFDVDADETFFPFYKAQANSLLGNQMDVASALSLATETGGTISFTFHPGDANPVEELLSNISHCEGPLWLSYYHVELHVIGGYVLRRLGELVANGCDVRFLLHRQANNQAAVSRLQSVGVSVHFPDDGGGSVTLGHKIVMVRSAGNIHLVQSSSNLVDTDYRYQHNLSVYLIGDYPSIERVLNLEFSRYW